LLIYEDPDGKNPVLGGIVGSIAGAIGGAVSALITIVYK